MSQPRTLSEDGDVRKVDLSRPRDETDRVYLLSCADPPSCTTPDCRTAQRVFPSDERVSPSMPWLSARPVVGCLSAVKLRAPVESYGRIDLGGESVEMSLPSEPMWSVISQQMNLVRSVSTADEEPRVTDKCTVRTRPKPSRNRPWLRPSLRHRARRDRTKARRWARVEHRAGRPLGRDR